MKLLGEAVRSALSQPVSSAVAALIIGGVCAVILSTTGQTVAAEQEVLARIDEAGTRSIVITDTSGGSGIGSDAVSRIESIAGVEWAIGLGPATDVRAVGNPGGPPAAVRQLYGSLPPQVVADTDRLSAREAIVGVQAQQTLGMIEPFGGVSGNTTLAVVGGFNAADPLRFLNTGLLGGAEGVGVLRSIHVLVADPSLVAPVSQAALMTLAAEDPTGIAVETSEALAEVRAAVQGELGRFGRQIVTLVLAAGLVLTALSVYGSVTSRRKDFGRRRALGASRGFIVLLVATQTGIAALVGAVLGTLISVLVLASVTGIVPDPAFSVAIIILAVLAATGASIPSAVVAAYRDPVRVLRVP